MKNLFPPLHIKLGLYKQFVKALNKDGNYFKYIYKTYPDLSYEKLKGDTFDGLHNRNLIKDPNFSHDLT